MSRKTPGALRAAAGPGWAGPSWARPILPGSISAIKRPSTTPGRNMAWTSLSGVVRTLGLDKKNVLYRKGPLLTSALAPPKNGTQSVSDAGLGGGFAVSVEAVEDRHEIARQEQRCDHAAHDDNGQG